jgi:hypothetical protein
LSSSLRGLSVMVASLLAIVAAPFGDCVMQCAERGVVYLHWGDHKCLTSYARNDSSIPGIKGYLLWMVSKPIEDVDCILKTCLGSADLY